MGLLRCDGRCTDGKLDSLTDGAQWRVGMDAARAEKRWRSSHLVGCRVGIVVTVLLDAHRTSRFGMKRAGEYPELNLIGNPSPGHPVISWGWQVRSAVRASQLLPKLSRVFPKRS